MELIFEGIMLLCLCSAMGIMLCRFAREKSIHVKLDRTIVITMGVGFVVGAISKMFSPQVEWTLVLYVIGAYLSYTATLFSFPELCKCEVNGNE